MCFEFVIGRCLHNTRVQAGPYRGWTEQGGDMGIADWTYAN